MVKEKIAIAFCGFAMSSCSLLMLPGEPHWEPLSEQGCPSFEGKYIGSDLHKELIALFVQGGKLDPNGPTRIIFSKHPFPYQYKKIINGTEIWVTDEERWKIFESKSRTLLTNENNIFTTYSIDTDGMEYVKAAIKFDSLRFGCKNGVLIARRTDVIRGVELNFSASRLNTETTFSKMPNGDIERISTTVYS
ncbi:MAG: hypothetical protein LBE50_04825, partial [Gallionellaceae bacterium]|nr:hypothetical protein [Gallionellaceae bacterium]